MYISFACKAYRQKCKCENRRHRQPYMDAPTKAAFCPSKKTQDPRRQGVRHLPHEMQMQIANCKLANGNRMQIAKCKFKTADRKMQIEKCKLQIANSKMQSAN